MTAILRTRSTPSLANAFKPASNERFFNNQGQMNAGSNQDAIQVLAMALQQIQNGNVLNPVAEETASRAEMFAEFAAAWSDRSTNTWAEMGASIALEITEVLARQGLMRRFLARADLEQGDLPRIRVRTRNVKAIIATGIGACGPQYVRDRYLMPPEFNVVANPRVTNIELNQGAPDLLDDVYLRSLEAIMVGEDRAYYNMLKRGVGMGNDAVTMVGGLSPTALVALRERVSGWNLSASGLILGTSAVSDILAQANGFANVFDPVSQYELMRTGQIGTLLGMAVTTDGFRDPDQRVLDANDVIVVADPSTHGGYTDRGPVEAVPVDQYPDGINARGWFVSETISMAIGNTRSYVFGYRR